MVEVIVRFKINRRSPAPYCFFTKGKYTNGLAPGLRLGDLLLKNAPAREREMRSGTAGPWNSGDPLIF